MLIELTSGHQLKSVRDATIEFAHDKVYLLFDAASESIFVEAGKKTPVNLRFFGSKVASQYAKQINFTYYLVSRLEDSEIFEQAVNRYRAWSKSRKRLPKVFSKIDLGSMSTGVAESPLPQKLPDKSISADFSEIMNVLHDLEPIAGNILDYVVVCNQIFAVEKSDDGYIYTELQDVADGIFDVTNYVPRVYIKQSKLIAVEFWRNTP